MTAHQYLLRFIQQHPKFRLSELESCAVISDTKQPLNFIEYNDEIPFAILGLEGGPEAAANLVKRSILTQYILLLKSWF
jgi:tRNA G10  N-methylase Trm11